MVTNNLYKTILDIGCGNQPWKHRLVAHGLEYSSLDLEQNAHNNVDYVCAIDGQLPKQLSKRDAFDVLLCTEVLEHVVDWNAAFSNLASILRRDGILILTIPFLYQPHEIPNDYWRTTKYAIKVFAESYGFAIVEEKAVGSGLDVLGTILSCSHSLPVTRSLRSKVVSGLANKWLQVGLWLAKSTIGKRNVEINSPYYLSNVCVLLKK